MTTQNRHIRSFAKFHLLVSALSVLCALCGQSAAQEWKTLNDGVEYAEVRREFGGKAVNINLLRLDLKKVRLDVHHALDAAIGTEKTSSIATRHGAFAAINAGFFRLDKTEFAGDPSGILMIDGHLVSESFNNRIALVIRDDKPSTSVLFSHLTTKLSVNFGQVGQVVPVEPDGINRQRGIKEAVIYTSNFGESTRTKESGLEIAVSKCPSYKTAKNFSLTVCRRIVILENSNNAPIPKGGYVLSLGPEFQSGWFGIADYLELLRTLKPNSVADIIRLVKSVKDDKYISGKQIDITNGVPQLIKNGKIDITWEQEKAAKSFVETRHPRTAVAKLKDGKFLMITADGRTEQSAGLDLYDLAAYLLELGATDAMNLDGGGSTTMFVDGKVVNKPSDKEGERKVSDAILVTLRKKKKR